MAKSPYRVVLPDGLINVVCICVNGQLMDPIVCVDPVDAEMRANEVVVAHQAMPGAKPLVQIGTYKVRVVPSVAEVHYA